MRSDQRSVISGLRLMASRPFWPPAQTQRDMRQPDASACALHEPDCLSHRSLRRSSCTLQWR